jgi:flagellar basal-body rod modification protein FlgD
MEVTQLTGGTDSVSQTRNRAQMSREDFLKILVAELSQQDPMSPLENEQFLNQLVSLQTLETSESMSNNFSSLILRSEVASAGQLMGKWVAGVDEAGDLAEGIVSRVLIDGDKVKLMLENGRSVLMKKVVEIQDAPQGA